MNKEEIQKLKDKIIEFDNQDVYIELEQSIQYHITIKKAKIIVSREKLIVSDEQEQDFIVELHYLDNIEIEGNSIYMELSNDLKITLDY